MARPALESGAVGAILGGVDVHLVESAIPMLIAYFASGVVAGCRHAGRAWSCWLPLGISMYLVHLAAIRLGYQPPYAEADAVAARQQLILFFPVSAGLLVGGAVRFGLAGLGYFPRRAGPPVRLVPRTTRGLVAVIVGLAVGLGFLRWLAVDAMTVYAPGFTERKFHQVQVGETRQQVEARLGSPVSQHEWPDHVQVWAYSVGVSASSSYWRNWVFFEDDKVKTILSDYWWD